MNELSLCVRVEEGFGFSAHSSPHFDSSRNEEEGGKVT